MCDKNHQIKVNLALLQERNQGWKVWRVWIFTCIRCKSVKDYFSVNKKGKLALNSKNTEKDLLMLLRLGPQKRFRQRKKYFKLFYLLFKSIIFIFLKSTVFPLSLETWKRGEKNQFLKKILIFTLAKFASGAFQTTIFFRFDRFDEIFLNL